MLTYISPHGIFLIVFGILRIINSGYDLTREDSLRKKMRLLTQTFADISALSGSWIDRSMNHHQNDQVLVLKFVWMDPRK